MAKSQKASPLIDTRVIYCGDNVDQAPQAAAR